jgi:hypothetical protein
MANGRVGETAMGCGRGVASGPSGRSGLSGRSGAGQRAPGFWILAPGSFFSELDAAACQAKGRSLTPQLIPVLQAVCAPGFADGVSLF